MSLIINVKDTKEIKNKPMTGTAKDSTVYGVNNVYMTRNEKPMLPVTGEFHFSRYPKAEWKQALLKMKAGGVKIVATYVFWIHHEEEEGIFDFSEERDVRSFLELCNELGLLVWFRIGPWCHGEVRNGGFPDWLVKKLNHNGLFVLDESKPFRHPRTNDELYMNYVTLFWTRLAKEAEGMYVKDGGPIVGIQLENEYCHAGGAPTREMGVEHMIALKKLAIELGFIAPYYTSTGWGGGMVIEEETLPVMGGYVDAPWADSNEELPASENFLFTPFHDDSNIATDLATGILGGYNVDTNPYLTAELGGGLQPTHLRRTYPYPEDIEAQSLCMLGAGANLIGYYMYHGGVNPEGKLSTLQESKATGYFNDLPVKCYDFQTCVRESGKIGKSYHKTKKLHTFINDFEEVLAPTQFYAAEVQPESPEDLTTPRVAVRYDTVSGTGFVFINNHQRKRKMQPISGLDIEINLPDDRSVLIEDITVDSGSTAVIPFGFRLNKYCWLNSTNASLLAHVGDCFFFYADGREEDVYFDFEEDDETENIILLTKEEAEYAYHIGDKLYITDKQLIEEDGMIYILTSSDCKVKVFDASGNEKTIKVKAAFGEVNEKYLHVDFDGDRAEAFDKNGKLLTDWFSNGEEWVIATKRYGFDTDLNIKVYPYEEGVYYDLPPKKGCGVNKKFVETEYKVPLI